MSEPTFQHSGTESGRPTFHLALQSTTSSETGAGHMDMELLESDSERREHRTEKPKRPKIDKDGFVTPATPETKTSMYFHDSAINQASHGFNFDDKSVESSSKQESLEAMPKMTPETGPREVPDVSSGYNILSSSGMGDAAMSNSIVNGIDPPKPPKTVSDLLKELGQEAKMLNLQWSQVLSESENVELFCPTRLEKILEEALALEEHLKHQKERLRLRLQALSRTLQLS